MEKITAIIVDDEPEARDILSSLLSDFSEIEVVAKEESVDRAMKTMKKVKPDLLFLDIDMPKKNGFDLVRLLKKHQISPTIIFVTAYNQFAIEAIKHAAFDYLLKPVDIDDLKQSIQRYKDERKTTASLNRIETLLEALQNEKIQFSTRTGYIFIDPASIIYCEAEHNYTDIYMTSEQRQTVTVNLGRVEQLLPAQRFAKINRSILINRQFLTEINRKEKKCILKVDDDVFPFKIASGYVNQL
ncbi:MAG: LytR/AlgR family response regulator transcription factor [Bacteroidales bacterium]